MIELTDVDALIERLNEYVKQWEDFDHGTWPECRAMREAAAALVQLRDSEALARGKIAEQIIEIANLRGESQCFTCGGPATAHWCDLHRPTLLNGPAIAKETHDQAVLDRGAEQMRRLRGKPCDCVRPEIHGHQLLCKHGKAR